MESEEIKRLKTVITMAAFMLAVLSITIVIYASLV